MSESPSISAKFSRAVELLDSLSLDDKVQLIESLPRFWGKSASYAKVLTEAFLEDPSDDIVLNTIEVLGRASLPMGQAGLDCGKDIVEILRKTFERNRSSYRIVEAVLTQCNSYAKYDSEATFKIAEEIIGRNLHNLKDEAQSFKDRYDPKMEEQVQVVASIQQAFIIDV